MATKYTVRAVPHEGCEYYFRAGFRFSPEPQSITVTPREPGAPRGSYDFTPEEFEVLRADVRIKIDGVENAAPPPPTNPEGLAGAGTVHHPDEPHGPLGSLGKRGR